MPRKVPLSAPLAMVWLVGVLVLLVDVEVLKITSSRTGGTSETGRRVLKVSQGECFPDKSTRESSFASTTTSGTEWGSRDARTRSAPELTTVVSFSGVKGLHVGNLT